MSDLPPPPPDFERDWRARFEEFAKKNDADAGIAGWSETGLATRLARFAALFQECGAQPGQAWMDVGCGAGTYSQFLHGEGLNVVGFDYSVPALGKAKTRYDAAINWVAADAKRLPLPDASADGVLCFGVVQALAESERLILELRRVLKPGGQLWIDALNGWCIPHLVETARRRLQKRAMHVRYESPATMADLLRIAGFTDIQRFWLPIVPGRFRQMQQWLDRPAIQKTVQAVTPLGAGLSHSVLFHARAPGGLQ